MFIKLLKKRFCLVWVILTTQLVCAQETMPVSGVEATGADNSVSYTIGQLVYTNLTTTTGSLNQGIQQRLEFVTLSNLELMAIILIALTYPKLKTACL
jgi:hypothetical protein